MLGSKTLLQKAATQTQAAICTSVFHTDTDTQTYRHTDARALTPLSVERFNNSNRSCQSLCSTKITSACHHSCIRALGPPHTHTTSSSLFLCTLLTTCCLVVPRCIPPPFTVHYRRKRPENECALQALAPTSNHKHRHADTQTHRRTDAQTHRHTDTQAHRHTDTDVT